MASVRQNENEAFQLLMQAAKDGRKEDIITLLDNGAPVNITDKYGQTPLIKASLNGHVDCIQLLLQRGANVNHQDKGGWTSLMWASFRMHLKCAKLLMDWGAQINSKDETFITYVNDTVIQGKREEMTSLLNLGVPINTTHEVFYRWIIEAAKDGKTKEVKSLLDRGVPVNVKDENAQTLLMKASSMGHVDCVQLLLDRGAHVNLQDNDGQTALTKASSEGHVDCAQLLLDGGAQINPHDELFHKWLIQASKDGKVKLLTFMLLRGAPANITNEDGWSPLMKASCDGHVECVKILLERSALINQQNKYGQTALMLASSEGHADIVQMLLTSGAQVNKQDSWGNTALHTAVKANMVSCVRVLLSKPEIDISIKDIDGRTAVMDAGFENLVVFNQMVRTSPDFHADAYGKVILCGNSGAGKSTFAQVGKLCNMVIHDTLGQHQYFSSHSTFLEAISLHNPAIFIVLLDIRNNPSVLTEELHHWGAAIEVMCHNCSMQSSVIVVGTHADLLTLEELTTQMDHLNSSVGRAICYQKVIHTAALNLKSIPKEKMEHFLNVLYKACSDITNKCPPISLMCHTILAFCKEKLPPEIEAVSFSDLCAELSNSSLQPMVILKLIETALNSLTKNGLIVFIPSRDNNGGWVILNKEKILHKIHKVLFGDSSLVSNTGIISTSVLEEKFPEYRTEMITEFLVHLQLCQMVNPVKEKVSLSPNDSSSSKLGSHLAFPALVKIDRGNRTCMTFPSNAFSWLLVVQSANQFFVTSLLHLIHRMITNDLSTHITPLRSYLHRHYYTLSNGTKRTTEADLSIIVEMSVTFQSLSLDVSCPDWAKAECLQLAHSIIAVIMKACKEFCPHLKVSEIICPPEAISDDCDDSRVELLSNGIAQSVNNSLIKQPVSPPEGSTAEASSSRSSVNLHVATSSTLNKQATSHILAEESQTVGTSNVIMATSRRIERPNLSKPTIKDLINEVGAIIPTKWEFIGIQLEVPQSVLDDIQSQVAGKPSRDLHAFKLMLSKWKMLHPDQYTWRNIIDALETPSVGEVELAARLKTKYLN